MAHAPCPGGLQSIDNLILIEPIRHESAVDIRVMQSEVGTLADGELRERTPARVQQRTYSRVSHNQSLSQRHRSGVRDQEHLPNCHCQIVTATLSPPNRHLIIRSSIKYVNLTLYMERLLCITLQHS